MDNNNDMESIKRCLEKRVDAPIYSESSHPYESISKIFEDYKNIVHPSYIQRVIEETPEYKNRNKFKPIERKRIIEGALNLDREEYAEYLSGVSIPPRYVEDEKPTFNIHKLCNDIINSKGTLSDKINSLNTTIEREFGYWENVRIDRIENYVMHKIVNSYSKHPLFAPVLKGETTLEETTEKILKRYSGMRGFLPHRKDKKYDNLVKQLDELIYVFPEFKPKGIFVPDNPITAFVEGTAGLMGSAFIGYITRDSKVMQSITTVAMLFSSVMMLIGPAMIAKDNYDNKENLKYCLEQAREIDKVVQRLNTY